IVGQMLGLGMVLSLIVMPLVRLMRFLFEPARPQEVNQMRAILSFGLLGIGAAAILCVPLPYYVAATFEVQTRDAASVYVEVPGELRAIRAKSGAVAAGDVIAELADSELRLAAQRLLSQQADLAARIDGIRQRAH